MKHQLCNVQSSIMNQKKKLQEKFVKSNHNKLMKHNFSTFVKEKDSYNKFMNNTI